jgi:hypothetical protein
VGEGVEQLSDVDPESVESALGGFAKKRFEFGKEVLDRFQIGRVGW